MVKRVSFLLVFFFVFSFGCVAIDAPKVSASSAILMVAQTGEILYEKNAYERRGMASTTKIMTALLVLESATPQRVVITTEQMVNVEGTSMGLKVGDKVSFHDLVYGMLLASGNDAANTAAISIDGSTDKFAQRMNKKAAQIGMTNTNFVTPSGLDDENHYSTAYDMALLGCYAIRNPYFLDVCSSERAELCYGNEPYKRWLTNHNKLLASFNGAIGIKTGFTKKSGRCLVSAAERNGITLVCVTLNAPDDWNDHKKLFEYGFDRVTLKSINVSLPKLNVMGGNVSEVLLTLSEPFKIASLCNVEDFSVELKLKQSEFAPISQGEVVGDVLLLYNGNVVEKRAVLACDSVYATTSPVNMKYSLFSRIKNFFISFFKKVKQKIMKGIQ